MKESKFERVGFEEQKIRIGEDRTANDSDGDEGGGCLKEEEEEEGRMQ